MKRIKSPLFVAQAAAVAGKVVTILFRITITVCASMSATGSGVWKPLANPAPDGVELMILLPNGSVMAADQPGGQVFSSKWFLLTPDRNGSYINGAWSVLSSMKDTRSDYSSEVLTNGQVWVAGGEYGTGCATSEIYDPTSDTWRPIPILSSLLDPSQVSPEVGEAQGFYDSISKILPNGSVLVAPVGANNVGGTLVFNPASASFANGPVFCQTGYPDQAEASWVKLPDDSILTADPAGTTTERYIPSLNKWIADASTPVTLYTNSEIGPALLLPNGKALFFGATGHTAIYTPSGSTNFGTWTAGPDLPNNLTPADAPAAMMPNGKVLCVAGPFPLYSAPSSFYEYDGAANTFTAASGPTGPTYSARPYGTKMLDLPDGTILFSTGGCPQLFVYQPDGSALTEGKPTISNITLNASDGSYHMTGTLLNGISEGAVYGDDAQMDSNYPLVRLTDSSNNVYYARTYNWSSTSVMATNRLVSTEFALPDDLPPASYSLVAVANGIASDPLTFHLPLRLHIAPLVRSGGVVLTWPSFPSNVALETCTNVGSGSWARVAVAPALVEGEFVLTNNTSGAPGVFRLRIQ